jgi:cyclopropane fatty-acyl-phospholipid synthase-like methyltransferase
MLRVNFNKPFAQSSEENKQVILEQLKALYGDVKNVLEIGSGTGQHAVYFAQQLEHLKWQPTELSENIPGINLWLEGAQLNNIEAPLELNVEQNNWRLPTSYDAVFTANTLHIMSIKHVELLFKGLQSVLNDGGLFCCYGPFNKNGKFTSESNANFDVWLKQRDSVSGIRDMSELTAFAGRASLNLIDDIEMPANNRILVWKKV